MRRVIVSFVALLAACGVPETATEVAPEETLAAEVEQQALLGAHGKLVLQDHPLTRLLYKESTKAWLRWAMKLPWSTGPINDTTGAACALGQQGPLWNLAGTAGGPVTRSCTVPRGKLLFFPLVNNWVIPPPQFVDTPEELANVQSFVDGYFPELRAATCGLTLRLDGQEVLADTAERDQKLYVELNDPFPLFMNPTDNFGTPGNPGGNMPAAWVNGHFALFLPLSPGQHTIELGGKLCDGSDVFFETSATYNLTVQH